jgi:hypothetical protein
MVDQKDTVQTVAVGDGALAMQLPQRVRRANLGVHVAFEKRRLLGD